MRHDELTTRAAALLSTAERLARQSSHQAVEVPHLGLALLSETDGLVGPLIAKLGANSNDLKTVFDDVLKALSLIHI